MRLRFISCGKVSQLGSNLFPALSNVPQNLRTIMSAGETKGAKSKPSGVTAGTPCRLTNPEPSEIFVACKLGAAFEDRFGRDAHLDTTVIKRMVHEASSAERLFNAYFKLFVIQETANEPAGFNTPGLAAYELALELCQNDRFSAISIVSASEAPSAEVIRDITDCIDSFHAYSNKARRLPVNLLLFRIPRDQLFGMFSLPFVKQYFKDPRVTVLPHAAVQIGPYVLHFTTDGVILPRIEIGTDRRLFQFLVSSIALEYGGWTFRPTRADLMAVCQALVKVNTTWSHSLELFSEDRHNCFEFVRRVMEALLPAADQRGKSWLLSGSGDGNAIYEYMRRVRTDPEKWTRMLYQTRKGVTERDFDPQTEEERATRKRIWADHPITYASEYGSVPAESYEHARSLGDRLYYGVVVCGAQRNHIGFDVWCRNHAKRDVPTTAELVLLKGFDRAFWLRCSMKRYDCGINAAQRSPDCDATQCKCCYFVDASFVAGTMDQADPIPPPCVDRSKKCVQLSETKSKERAQGVDAKTLPAAKVPLELDAQLTAQKLYHVVQCLTKDMNGLIAEYAGGVDTTQLDKPVWRLDRPRPRIRTRRTEAEFTVSVSVFECEMTERKFVPGGDFYGEKGREYTRYLKAEELLEGMSMYFRFRAGRTGDPLCVVMHNRVTQRRQEVLLQCTACVSLGIALNQTLVTVLISGGERLVLVCQECERSWTHFCALKGFDILLSPPRTDFGAIGIGSVELWFNGQQAELLPPEWNASVVLERE